MNKKEIIKIIKTRNEWFSDDLIKKINSEDKKQVKIKFCHIGGYELLKDGTQTNVCKSLKDVQDHLDEYGIEYDDSITDPDKLVASIYDEWVERYDDGGGSAWIE